MSTKKVTQTLSEEKPKDHTIPLWSLLDAFDHVDTLFCLFDLALDGVVAGMKANTAVYEDVERLGTFTTIIGDEVGGICNAVKRHVEKEQPTPAA